jgi:hypothetical protein
MQYVKADPQKIGKVQAAVDRPTRTALAWAKLKVTELKYYFVYTLLNWE